MAHRLPKDFNVQSPPLEVTDPDRAEQATQGLPHDPEYPKHLVKPDLDGPGGPASRELVVVTDAKAERSARADGFMSHHDADVAERKAKPSTAAAAAKPTAARKPANPKPKPKVPATEPESSVN